MIYPSSVLVSFSHVAILWALAVQWALSVYFKAEVLNFIGTVLKISKVLMYVFQIGKHFEIILDFL